MTYAQDPIVLDAQGSFTVGGMVIATPGIFDPVELLSTTGNTGHVDHAYVQYQIPAGVRRLPLVMWHGGGQFGKTWETTPDGREGFQNLLVRRHWAVYVVDQPGRGRAGNGSVSSSVEPWTADRSLWQIFRLGLWPNFYAGVQFDTSADTIEQYLRQVTPDSSPESADRITAASVALFDKIGPAILVSHSKGGLHGFRAILKTGKIVANVAYEPAAFIYPHGDVPSEISDYEAAFNDRIGPVVVAPEVFERLTRIPIQLVYGDNIPEERSPYASLEYWRVVLARAEQFADAVNKRGGDVSILHLPKIGIKGNTHFPFSDLNNLKILDLLSKYLAEKRLDGLTPSKL